MSSPATLQPCPPGIGPSRVPQAPTSSLPLAPLPGYNNIISAALRPNNTQFDRYQQFLQAAREAAEEDEQYSSLETRKRMTEQVQKCCNGITPHNWQLDVAEALYLGVDTALIAGTGAGKTMPFAMTLLADKSEQSKLIIISTLNELEKDQAIRFNKMGLKAAAVNGETWDKVCKAVTANQYRIILTSPEMILKHDAFSKLVRSANWMKNYVCTIIDEAHCVVKWGKNFRKEFSEIEKIRSFMTGSKPFLIASATLPPVLLDDTLKTLDMRRNNMFLVNRGNDRRNITTLVCKMKGGINDLADLDFTVDEVFCEQDLIRTIIYMNTRDLTTKSFLRLIDKIPPQSQSQIDFIHGRRSKRAKARVMRRFRNGEIKLLIATEVAGMGMDIPDVQRVVQFMVPDSLLTWYQHAGRAGRDGKNSEGILLVERSVYEKIKRSKKKKRKRKGKIDIKQEEEEEEPSFTLKRKHQDVDHGADQAHADHDDPDDGDSPDPLDGDNEGGDETTEDIPLEYRKNVEGPLRRMIETVLCRRLEPNIYFKNPVSDKNDEGADFCCCDNCLHDLGQTSMDPLTDRAVGLLALKRRIETRELTIDDNASDTSEDNVTDNGEHLEKTPKMRYGEHKAKVTKALEDWRRNCWAKNFKDCSWGEQGLLHEDHLKAFARNRRIFSAADLKQFAPSWPFAEELGKQVFKAINRIDKVHDELKEAERARKRTKSAENQAIRLEQHNEKRRRSEPVKTDAIMFHMYDGAAGSFGEGIVHAGPSSLPQAQVYQPPLSSLPPTGYGSLLLPPSSATPLSSLPPTGYGSLLLPPSSATPLLLPPCAAHPTPFVQPLFARLPVSNHSHSMPQASVTRAYAPSQPMSFMYSQHTHLQPPPAPMYQPPYQPQASSSSASPSCQTPSAATGLYYKWKL